MMNGNADIVILDDNLDLCEMMDTVLTHEGYNVAPCTVVSCMKDELAKHQPPLLIMDLMLKEARGSEICNEIKAAGNAPKILMVSGHPEAETICLAAGADDFLAKPFDLRQFTGKVATLMASGGVAQAAQGNN